MKHEDRSWRLRVSREREGGLMPRRHHDSRLDVEQEGIQLLLPFSRLSISQPSCRRCVRIHPDFNGSHSGFQ